MGGRSSHAVPIAIVVAGIFIAAAVYMVGTKQSVSTIAQNEQAQTTSVRAIGADDHVLGNPAAPVVIIGYSDTECPYCKEYHKTLHTLVEAYGQSGNVAWVYRHFPITQLHPKAAKEAEALECAGAQGGENMFWKYTDAVYTMTTSNNTLDIGAYNKVASPTGSDAGALSTLAKTLGLDVTVFEACLQKDTYATRVSRDSAEAIAIGGTGTPMSVILVGTEQIPVPGAQTYETLKGLIDTIIATSKTE